MSVKIGTSTTTLTIGGTAGGDCYWVYVNGVRTMVCGIQGQVVDSVPDGGDGQMPPPFLRILTNLKGRLSDVAGLERQKYVGYLVVENHGERHKVHLLQGADAHGHAHIVGHADGAGKSVQKVGTSERAADGLLTVHLKAVGH